MTNPVSGGFQFTPATGLNDTVTYPSTPISEAAARQQFMDMYWQLMNEMNKPTLSAAAYAQYNKLINGNFDVWTRGTSFTNPTSGVYLADRWVAQFNFDGGTSPSIVHSRQLLTSGDIPGASWFSRINTDGAGSAFGVNAEYPVRQKIENGTIYLCGANKKVTVSFWARSSIANKKIGIRIIQRYGTGGSPSANELINGTNFTLTSTWTKYSYTFTTNTLVGKSFGTNNDDVLDVTFGYMWGSTFSSNFGATTQETFIGAGNIDISQIQVNAGDQAIPFQPKDPEDETRKSLRYSWIPQTNSVFVRMVSAGANAMIFNVPIPVQLRTNPNIRGTVNTDIIVYNPSGVAQTGFTASAVVNSSGVTVTMTKTAHGLTDGYLEIKTTSGFDAELF